jgi:hypothetical protein
MGIFKPHPQSIINLIATVEAHEHALALWGFLEISHQQLYSYPETLGLAEQAVAVGSRAEVETVLATSRWLGDMVEDCFEAYFDDDEVMEKDREEALAWARGTLELDPEIGEHLWDFKAAQLLLEKARERGYA